MDIQLPPSQSDTDNILSFSFVKSLPEAVCHIPI